MLNNIIANSNKEAINACQLRFCMVTLLETGPNVLEALHSGRKYVLMIRNVTSRRPNRPNPKHSVRRSGLCSLPCLSGVFPHSQTRSPTPPALHNGTGTEHKRHKSEHEKTARQSRNQRGGHKRHKRHKKEPANLFVLLCLLWPS